MSIIVSKLSDPYSFEQVDLIFVNANSIDPDTKLSIAALIFFLLRSFTISKSLA
jgi:hypothetical protein